MRRRAVIGATIALMVAGTAFVSAAAGGHKSAAPDPKNFVRRVTNPYFPLKPGTVLIYRGIKDGQVQIDRVTVTHRTRAIQGVTTTAVRDVAKQGSHVLEATTDWYAQDKQGNVWYFGEDTKSYENGKVDTSGSWLAGRDGAVAGVLMEADPKAPDAYRQEFYRAQAEDMAWVVHRGSSIRVPYGRIDHALLTIEWTRLEPNVIDKKFYGRGIGILREASQSGPHETAELVRVLHNG
jgi:hypothetical protein